MWHVQMLEFVTIHDHCSLLGAHNQHIPDCKDVLELAARVAKLETLAPNLHQHEQA